MRMLDLFCGRWGWSRAFAAKGWECIGVDLVSPPDRPQGCKFIDGDVLGWQGFHIRQLGIDFICASPPCEQFSIHGMRHFHPMPPYPQLGIDLFQHTRYICEASEIPYVIENVRAAQQFVGKAVHHCGPFYLWGNAVPPILPQGIVKGRRLKTGGYRTQKGTNLKEAASIVATIPPELASCVANYAESLFAMTPAKQPRSTVAVGRDPE